MAPTLSQDSLIKRQFGYGYGYNNNYSSPWYNYGRWILLVGLIVLAVLIALTCSCMNARKRRRQGVMPMYGTGWLAGKTPEGHNGPSYTGYNNNNTTTTAPPQYSAPQNPQYTGQNFNSNEGYYGQQNGIELQQPSATYAGNGGYAAPAGPPPVKQHY